MCIQLIIKVIISSTSFISMSPHIHILLLYFTTTDFILFHIHSFPLFPTDCFKLKVTYYSAKKVQGKMFPHRFMFFFQQSQIKLVWKDSLRYITFSEYMEMIIILQTFSQMVSIQVHLLAEHIKVIWKYIPFF
jgi:hypothetical protein